jgi:hypothetical protein
MNEAWNMLNGRFYVFALTVLFMTVASSHAWKGSPLFAAGELGLNKTMPDNADFDRPFEAPLPALVSDANGKRMIQLSCCRDYLSVRNHIIGSDTDADYRVLRFQTVSCDALALLKSAIVALHAALPRDFRQLTATRSYPATLWPAVSDEEHRKLARKGATLRSASGRSSLRVEEGGVLELESTGFGIRLTLLARGDFDHDGWEDAAFRWEGYALKGSYSDARLAVLTRTGNGRGLHELDLNKLMSAKRRCSGKGKIRR